MSSKYTYWTPVDPRSHAIYEMFTILINMSNNIHQRSSAPSRPQQSRTSSMFPSIISPLRPTVAEKVQVCFFWIELKIYVQKWEMIDGNIDDVPEIDCCGREGTEERWWMLMIFDSRVWEWCPAPYYYLIFFRELSMKPHQVKENYCTKRRDNEFWSS